MSVHQMVGMRDSI